MQRARDEQDHQVVHHLHHQDRDGVGGERDPHRRPEASRRGAPRCWSAGSRRRTPAPRQRDARAVGPAPPGRQHHAEHLADRTAGEAVQGRARPRCSRTSPWSDTLGYMDQAFPGVCRLAGSRRASRRRDVGSHLCNSLHRGVVCGMLPAWPSSTRSWSRSPSDPRPGWSSPAASTGRSGSSGAPRTSRSTGCWPAWRPTAGVRSRTVAQQGRPAKKVYEVAPAGRRELARWIAADTPVEQFRSEVAVKLRGASYGDRAAVLAQVARAPRRARDPARALRAARRGRLPATRPRWTATTSTSTSCCAAASASSSSGWTG